MTFADFQRWAISHDLFVKLHIVRGSAWVRAVVRPGVAFEAHAATPSEAFDQLRLMVEKRYLTTSCESAVS